MIWYWGVAHKAAWCTALVNLVMVPCTAAVSSYMVSCSFVSKTVCSVSTYAATAALTLAVLQFMLYHKLVPQRHC